MLYFNRLWIWSIFTHISWFSRFARFRSLGVCCALGNFRLHIIVYARMIANLRLFSFSLAISLFLPLSLSHSILTHSPRYSPLSFWFRCSIHLPGAHTHTLCTRSRLYSAARIVAAKRASRWLETGGIKRSIHEAKRRSKADLFNTYDAWTPNGSNFAKQRR